MVEWERQMLFKEMAAKDSFRIAVEAIIGKDMAQKLPPVPFCTNKLIVFLF